MTTDFTSTIVVENPAMEVFNAINNVRGWWQGEITGRTDQLGEEFDYRMKDFHFSRQKVTELMPGKKVVWLVTDSNLSNFADKGEWTGTTIVFDILEKGNKTEVRFTHKGLVPKFQCYGDCSWAWGLLVQESLFNLIAKGSGVNVFG